jgi:hypothetical protein
MHLLCVHGLRVPHVMSPGKSCSSSVNSFKLFLPSLGNSSGKKVCQQYGILCVKWENVLTVCASLLWETSIDFSLGSLIGNEDYGAFISSLFDPSHGREKYCIEKTCFIAPWTWSDQQQGRYKTKIKLRIPCVVLCWNYKVSSHPFYHLSFIIGLIEGVLQYGIRVRRSQVRVPTTYIPLCIIIFAYAHMAQISEDGTLTDT